jgi:glycosidase
MAYADGDLDGALDWDGERTYGFEHDVEVDHDSSYERLGVGFAFLLTIPHVPLIYYGDEVGLTGAEDPDNRRMMVFDNLSAPQLKLRDTLSRLTRIRREHPALWQGDFLSLHVDDDTWLYARSNFDEVMLVALNRADTEKTVSATLPPILGLVPEASLTDLLGGPPAEVGEGSSLSLTLPPRSAKVLQMDR